MKARFVKTACVALLSFFMYAFGSLSLASDLIAPTRTLQGKTQEQGRLTVFSEPLKLQVFLDGKKAGETPLWLTEVKAGRHTVRIREKTAQVYVGPQKTLLVGLFKGSLITLPEKKKERQKPLGLEQQRGTVFPETVKPTEEQRKEELTRWDLFVNGSLRHF